MITSYEYFKNGGAKEIPLEQLPKDYAWVTGCSGDGWYWNFFMKDTDLIVRVDPKKTFMCKIKKL